MSAHTSTGTVISRYDYTCTVFIYTTSWICHSDIERVSFPKSRGGRRCDRRFLPSTFPSKSQISTVEINPRRIIRTQSHIPIRGRLCTGPPRPCRVTTNMPGNKEGARLQRQHMPTACENHDTGRATQPGVLLYGILGMFLSKCNARRCRFRNALKHAVIR